MMFNYQFIKNELRNILSGTGEVSQGATLQAVTHYLRRSQKTSGLVATDKQFKAEEAENLISYADKHNLWVHSLDFDTYLTEGAEQRVYIKDEKTVLKLNDSIYYATWLDYFYSLLLNNYFFPDTAYSFKGFYLSEENILYALIEQPFVKATQHTNLAEVKTFLQANGFINTRNNDYYHSELGIILEDLHDENVLTQNGILYFVDTVFYITPNALSHYV